MSLLVLTVAVNAVIWNEGVEGELHWGERLIMGNYSLNLDDFSTEESGSPKILVDLQRDNISLTTWPLYAGESFSLNDSIKVSADKIVMGGLREEPYAVVRMQLAAKPDVSLLLVSDKDVYNGGDFINLDLNIENTGVIDVEGLRIILDSNPSIATADYNRSTLKAGTSWDDDVHTQKVDPIRIALRAPYLAEPAEVLVRVRARYTDMDGNAGLSFGGTTFLISGSVQLHKTVEDDQEFGRTYYATDSISNMGERTLNIKLSDSTGPDFSTNSPLKWEFKLPGGETKIFNYDLIAVKPGMGLILPGAQAEYNFGNETHTIRSERPVVDVMGPFVEVKKVAYPSTADVGKEIVVSTEFNNTGNRKAEVSFREDVPGDLSPVWGKTSGSFILPPGEKQILEYCVRSLNAGEFIIPATIAYRDVRGNKFETSVPELEINVKEEKKIVHASVNISNQTVYFSRPDGKPEERASNKSGNIYQACLLFIAVLILSAIISRYP
ncbi:MAG: hypothetical protein ACE14P_01365 [Methanotrichaceae archaeon]